MIIGDRAGHVRRYTVTNNSDNGGRKDITGKTTFAFFHLKFKKKIIFSNL